MRRISLLCLVSMVAFFVSIAFLSVARANCPGAGPLVNDANVSWTLKDSVAACPAGDSLVSPYMPPLRPSLLRIVVNYFDANCLPRVGVPPESIWVLASPVFGGNLTVNQGPKIYADDSTDVGGHTRITIRSFSGCGIVSLTLRVSGVSFGTKTATVRTLDTLYTGDDFHVSASDTTNPCDITYSGTVNDSDRRVIYAAGGYSHLGHWRRNALFGTMIRRTNLGAGQPGVLGASRDFWSPSGRYIAFGGHPPGPCVAYIVASDPKDGGNGLRQITTSVNGSRDYDPVT